MGALTRLSTIGRLRLRLSAAGLALLLILAMAAWLRVDGLDWALPHIPNPDETRVVDSVMFGTFVNPKAVTSDYGMVPFHLLEAVGWVAGQVKPGYSLQDPEDRLFTYILARSIAVFFGVGTVVLVYLGGTLAYGRTIGLVASAFMAFTVLGIQLSHTYTVDVVLGFWTALFVVIGLRLIRQPNDLRYAALMVVVGVALATKFVAIFLFLPMAVALYFAGARSDKPGRPHNTGLSRTLLRVGSHLLVGLIVVLLTFAVLTPGAVLRPMDYFWLDFEDPIWWHALNFPEGNLRLLWNLLLAEGALRPLWSWASAPDLRLLNPITSLLPWSMGPLLLAMSGIGVAVLLRRREKADWFLLAYLLAAYLLVANSRVQFIRYVYPMVPVLAILAASPLSLIAAPWQVRTLIRVAIISAMAATLVASLVYSLAFTNIYRSLDTRLQAEQWIEENIPVGATVGIDGPDIFSDPYVDAARYRIHVLPIWDIYDLSTPHTYPSRGLFSFILREKLRAEDNVARLPEADIRRIVRDHLVSDYLVFSNRLKAQVESMKTGFDTIRGYYKDLEEGRSNYRLVKVFRSPPRLWRWVIDDSRAEHTFSIFDHPTIYIYQRKPDVDRL